MQNCGLDFGGVPVPVEMWRSFDCVDRFASKWIELRSECVTFLSKSDAENKTVTTSKLARIEKSHKLSG